MKKIKSIMATFFCLLMIFGGYTNVYANDINIGVSENPSYIIEENDIVPYSTYFPTKTWNLSSDGKYDFSGYIEKV